MECEEKEIKKRESIFNEQIQSLQKDKHRLEELMSLKDKEITTLKSEVITMKQQVANVEKIQDKFKKEMYKEAEDKFRA